MSDKLKFFSQEWCELALGAVNANADVYKGFKDPDSFTNRMEFGTIGKDDVACHIEWEKAKIVSWTIRKFDESDLWLKINGTSRRGSAQPRATQRAENCCWPERSNSPRGRCRRPSRMLEPSTISCCRGVRCPRTGTCDPLANGPCGTRVFSRRVPRRGR